MINYAVGDFVIQIKNACLAGKREIEVAETKLIKAVAQALKKEGYLDEVESKKGVLRVRLSYKRKKPVLINLRLVSKPGHRIYMNVDELAQKKGGSTYIITTPKGILSLREALKKGVGGEVIVEVW
jgi:small subunit ribosomal protein S8